MALQRWFYPNIDTSDSITGWPHINSSAAWGNYYSDPSLFSALLPNIDVWSQFLFFPGNGDITDISVANPTIVTTSAPHQIQNSGDPVAISSSNSTPSIDGVHTATILSPTTFSIPINVTGHGTTGKAVINWGHTFVSYQNLVAMLAAHPSILLCFPLGVGILSPAGAANDIAVLHALNSLGRLPDYVELNDPMLFAIQDHPGNPSAAISEIVTYMSAIHSAFPSIVMGHAQSVVQFGYNGHLAADGTSGLLDLHTQVPAMISAINGAGMTLAFAHSDYPYDWATGIIREGIYSGGGTFNWMADFVSLGNQFQSAGVRFGPLLQDALGSSSYTYVPSEPNPAPNEEAWFWDILDFYLRFVAAGGTVDDLVPFSFAPAPFEMLPPSQDFTYSSAFQSLVQLTALPATPYFPPTTPQILAHILEMDPGRIIPAWGIELPSNTDDRQFLYDMNVRNLWMQGFFASTPWDPLGPITGHGLPGVNPVVWPPTVEYVVGSRGRKGAPYTIKQHATSPSIDVIFRDGNGIPISLDGVWSVRLRFFDVLQGNLILNTFMNFVPAGDGGLASFRWADLNFPAGRYSVKFDILTVGDIDLELPTDGQMIVLITPTLI